MNKSTQFTLAIVVIAVFLGFVYLQLEIQSIQSTLNQLNQKPTSTPTITYPTISPTPNPTSIGPPAIVNASISTTPITNFHDTSIKQGIYLLIKGTVTNNSPNAAYNVGLHVVAFAVPFAGPQAVIDNIVPIQSGDYDTNTKYNLTTLNPYETVEISITVLPNYQSLIGFLEYPNATLTWSNMP